jgi:uncharacterized protein DUF1707
MSGSVPTPFVPVPRTGPVRIGDTERDQAVAELGEHFAAGRITREEFDERSDAVVRARFADDLAPLFADLPDPVAPRSRQRRRQGLQPGQQPRFNPGPPFFVLAPLFMIALVVSTVMLIGPWILWFLFAFALFCGGPRHRRFHQHHR